MSNAAMRYLLLASLLALAAALAAASAPARSPLELTWKLKQDLFGPNGRDVSVPVFTLTNRGTSPLPARGWAIYYTALHDANDGSATGAFRLENVTGSLQRIVPGPEFQGLAPGQSAEVEYRTSLLTNNSFAPNGVYAVFDDAASQMRPVDYTAVPFERAPQPGPDPHVITPEAQFELDAAVHEVPGESLPPVFPTPVSVERREGRLMLAALPAVAAAPELQGEAALAAGYLKPLFAAEKARSGSASPSAGAPALRLEIGKVEGQTSPEAYELVVDPKEGVRIVGNSPAGVFYGMQSLRGLLPAAAGPLQGGKAAAAPVALPALRVVDAPRFGHRGLMLDVARNFQPKAQVLRVLDLMSRYKLNVLHFHLTEDESWRVETPEPARADGRRRAPRPHARLEPPPAARVRLRRRRQQPVRQRLLLARRLRRDPALRRRAPHPGDPRDRDAGPRACGDKVDGSPWESPAREGRRRGGGPVPPQRPGRQVGLHLGPGLPRQRDEPGAAVDVRVHRARGGRPRGAPQGGGRAAAQPPPRRRRGSERRLGALARGGRLHEGARARLGGRALVRVLRPRRADREGARPRALGLGGARAAHDAARRRARS